MGMAASQARYICLTARQSNIEYQGQQINQERTILSQQCTDLYNSLLEMQVPTPPSTQDYTKVEYTGSDGATTFTLGLVKPSVAYPGNYNVEVKISATGDYMTKDNRTAVVVRDAVVYDTLKAKQEESIEPDPDNYTNKGIAGAGSYTNGIFMKDEGTSPTGPITSYFIQNADGSFSRATSSITLGSVHLFSCNTPDSTNPFVVGASDTTYKAEQNKIGKTVSSINGYYVMDESYCLRQAVDSDFECDTSGNPIRFKNGVKYYKQSTDADAGEYTNKSSQHSCAFSIEGYEAFDLVEASRDPKYSNYDWDSYFEAIKNKFGSSDAGIKPEDFYVYFRQTKTGQTEPCFAFKSDVESPDNRTDVYTYIADGQYIKSDMIDGCGLKFDSSGRIISIDLPTIDETTQEIKSYNTITLTANTITDTAAYEDAYAEYEYNMYKYDKAQQDINAKTEIIQQEDRNLELKLTRLDNERKAVNTELDAVKEVIKTNIDKSFKTFSG